ncbi:MAG: ABC transporter substrate-binding protein [Alphaproteobacteria bacterium]|nr:ABC transporter substrate-binding protein [Alphaproteobacteria bacterium]
MSASAQSIPESDEPIKLAMNEWTGQHISTYVAGETLKRMGYNVEYITAGYYPQGTAIADGDIDATLEIWTSNIGDGWDSMFDDGSLVVVGNAGLKPQEAWYVPTYVLDMCPGLPDWTALENCTDLFATAETLPSGRFLDYPADWGDTNARRIEALNMDYVSIPAGGEGAIIAEIKSAVERQAPLITMFWEPHWLHAQIDMTRVFLPEYFDGCHDDASLGLNPDATYDCDWSSAEIIKVANPALMESHPAAWNLIEVYSINNAEQAVIMAEVDDKGRDLEEVVNEWLDANPDQVQGWMDQASM